MYWSNSKVLILLDKSRFVLDIVRASMEMQLLEANSCEPWLQRPLACFWNYLCIISFLCFTHSPLAPLQPRLNDQLILGVFVVRMVEFPVDDIFHEIFVLIYFSSFLYIYTYIYIYINLHPNLGVNS